MKTAAIISSIFLLAPCAAPATEPASAPGADICATANNRILGPRTRNRPLPLMTGDAVHGFRPACSVPWGALSPKNEPLAISACFRGSLLQIDNDKACGAGKGRLWISARWVVTGTDRPPERDRAVICQQLETGVYSGTRGLSVPCVPSGRAPEKPDAPTAR